MKGIMALETSTPARQSCMEVSCLHAFPLKPGNGPRRFTRAIFPIPLWRARLGS
jgi:hypothetical protein